jgi:Pyridoxamine 5'-phosphate oxidase
MARVRAAARNRETDRARWVPVSWHRTRRLGAAPHRRGSFGAAAAVDSGRLVHLATINPDGTPQVTCVYVGWDGDEIVAGHLADHLKLRNIRRDPRPGRTEQTVRDSLTRAPSKASAADARDGRRGHHPWSVITTPVSA